MAEPISTIGALAGICGHDGTDWIKALIDAGGRLQVDIVDSGGADLGDLLDTLADCLTALEKIDDLQNALDSVGTDELDVNVESSVAVDAQLHGHIAAAWQKQPLVWGFSDAQGRRDTDTNADAGANTLQTPAVPTGQCEVYTHVFGINYTSAVAKVSFNVIINGTTYALYEKSTVAAGEAVNAPNMVICNEGDYVECVIYGCTAGDSIALHCSGYRMDTDL